MNKFFANKTFMGGGPTFDAKEHGCANFAEMVKAIDAVVEVKKGDNDHMLRLR